MTLLSDICEKIRNDIVSGELALGERLTIDDLSQRYGASHMPIREALRRLAGEGIVAMEPGRGARIPDVDPEFVSNLFDTRCALEATISRAAARFCTDTDIEALRLLEADRRHRVERSDFSGGLVLNRRFHNLIHRIARNPTAVEQANRGWVLVVALWHKYGYGADRFAGVASDHENIIHALASRDSDASAVLTHAHVLKAKFAMLSILPKKSLAIRQTKRRD